MRQVTRWFHPSSHFRALKVMRLKTGRALVALGWRGRLIATIKACVQLSSFTLWLAPDLLKMFHLLLLLQLLLLFSIGTKASGKGHCDLLSRSRWKGNISFDRLLDSTACREKFCRRTWVMWCTVCMYLRFKDQSKLKNNQKRLRKVNLSIGFKY